MCTEVTDNEWSIWVAQSVGLCGTSNILVVF